MRRLGRRRHRWQVPVSADRPARRGRTYEAVIRVNSQSGGGVAYIMKADHGLALPRRLQIEILPRDPGDRRPARAARSRPRDGTPSDGISAPVTPLEQIPPEGGTPPRPTAAPTPSPRWSGRNTEREIVGAGNSPLAAFCDAHRFRRQRPGLLRACDVLRRRGAGRGLRRGVDRRPDGVRASAYATAITTARCGRWSPR